MTAPQDEGHPEPALQLVELQDRIVAAWKDHRREDHSVMRAVGTVASSILLCLLLLALGWPLLFGGLVLVLACSALLVMEKAHYHHLTFDSRGVTSGQLALRRWSAPQQPDPADLHQSGPRTLQRLAYVDIAAMGFDDWTLWFESDDGMRLVFHVDDFHRGAAERLHDRIKPLWLTMRHSAASRTKAAEGRGQLADLVER